jgi:bifunctional enzyme CysN/CysC
MEPNQKQPVTPERLPFAILEGIREAVAEALKKNVKKKSKDNFMASTALAASPVSLTASAEGRDQLRIVIVGHIDHGKSTLVGRIFHDTGSLPEGKLEQITAQCKKRGMPFEWSFLMDALQAERDQGITIDTTQIWFRTQQREYCIIDAPGHREFLKNMITGAASSEAALLLIDAEEGVREQSKRHGYLLHLLGIKQVAVVVNKMDRVGYDPARFAEISREYGVYLQSIGVREFSFIPISAREGDMVVERGQYMGWYDGKTVIETLDGFANLPAPIEQPLRFPVQDVYKFDERRIIVGRIESGSLAVGDTILISPGNHTIAVKSIESFGTVPKSRAFAGEAVGITLEDQLFVERGNVISHVADAPVLAKHLRARLFWLGRKPLTQGKRYTLKINTAEFSAELAEIHHVIDTDALGEHITTEVERNQVAEVTFRLRGLAAVDEYNLMPRTGRFVVVEGYDIAGGGIISLEGAADLRVASHAVKSHNVYDLDLRITPEQRALMNGHTGGILWFTGLSGSGKSTLALEVQQRLFAKGYQVFVLDGDNIRQGLNSDLGFAPEDRSENIRRVGEVAALFARAGVIVISAFISPYREDRRRARAAAPEQFHSVYIKADVATCEGRDVKGLYKKAREGKIIEFTGISAPYEEPQNPDLVVDTSALSVEESVAKLIEYVEKQFVAPVKELRDSQGGI